MFNNIACGFARKSMGIDHTRKSVYSYMYISEFPKRGNVSDIRLLKVIWPVGPQD